MHWIQTIRENLQLSRRELAHYLRLSLHMIESVELNRRDLPADSLIPAITLYKMINDVQTHGPVENPTLANDHSLWRMKRLHRQCRRSLEVRTCKFEEMQRAHAHACLCLAIYQRMAQFLTPPQNENDLHCLQWTDRKINETMLHIQDNNTTAQDLLAAEIAGLRSMVQALERSRYLE